MVKNQDSTTIIEPQSDVHFSQARVPEHFLQVPQHFVSTHLYSWTKTL